MAYPDMATSGNAPTSAAGHQPSAAGSMSAIDALLTRSSNGALKAPAPPAATLDLALRCAMTAPDHAAQRPTRFIVVEGEGLVKLGRIFADALRRRQPDTPADMLEREAKKPLRAPMVIVAACAPKPGDIPELEQILSAGAAAQNLLLAFFATGYGAMWRTGDAAYDAGVKQALGLRGEDHIVGFIYVGTPVASPRQPLRHEAEVRRMAG